MKTRRSTSSWCRDKNIEERVVETGEQAGRRRRVSKGVAPGRAGGRDGQRPKSKTALASSNCRVTTARLADFSKEISSCNGSPSICVEAAGLRDGAHAAHLRDRRGGLLPSSASTASPRSTSRSSSSPRACRAPRPRRSRPRSPTRSRRRSTPSAASTSCARSPVEGVSQVFITFALDKNIDVAAQEVRDQVSTHPADLPQGIDLAGRRPSSTPTPRRSSTSRSTPNKPDPRGHRARRQARAPADREHPRRRPGASCSAARKRQINVWLDPVKLRADGLTAADVQRAHRASQNLTTPGRPRRDRARAAHAARRTAASRAPRRSGDIVVRRADGHPIRVARRRARRGRQGGGRHGSPIRDGEPAVVLVGPQAVGREHRRGRRRGPASAWPSASRRCPPATSSRSCATTPAVIRTSVDAVKEHLVLGALLAALVVLALPRQRCAARSSPPSPSRSRSSAPSR